MVAHTDYYHFGVGFQASEIFLGRSAKLENEKFQCGLQCAHQRHGCHGEDGKYIGRRTAILLHLSIDIVVDDVTLAGI